MAATVGSFDIQNRCKFVERFFLSMGVDRVRPLLLQGMVDNFQLAHKPAIGFF